MTVRIHVGDSLAILSTMPSESVHCVVTSPPYYGLRDYGVAGQMGMEETPAEFIANMVALFDEVRRVLRSDGTCWVNMGDSYARAGGTDKKVSETALVGSTRNTLTQMSDRTSKLSGGFKSKDLMMMPHRLAIALQDAGWYVRQDIVWAKPNPMPESVTDRCTKSHEYIFLLTKSAKYFYDAGAIKEDCVKGSCGSEFHTGKTGEHQLGRASTKPRGVGFGHGTDSEARGRGRIRTAGNITAAKSQLAYEAGDKKHRTKAGLLAYSERTRADAEFQESGKRNKRTVWTMATHSFKEAHFATFPPELPETCIKAGCPVGGTVLDPFFGAGTTGLVADRLQRDCIGIELNPAYAELARKRIAGDSPLLSNVEVIA